MRRPITIPRRVTRRLLLSAMACCTPFTTAWAQQDTSQDDSLQGGAQHNNGAQNALETLLNQADFWQQNQRPDLARQTLERYLAGRPNDPEVLYRLARLDLSDNQGADADQWISRLEQAAPNSPYLTELDQLRQGQTLNAEQLNRARQLANVNRYEESAAAYRELFEGSTPPRSLAIEYYQTLAGGSDEHWRQARDGLRQLAENAPQDAALTRALGEVLTYREGTRREGIERLAQMSQRAGPQAANARNSWRQALLWLDATPADETLYQAYLRANPDDGDILEHFETATAQTTRATGFIALETGELSSAEQAFRQALEENPQDSEAKAGLGLLLLRRQQFAQARDLLAEAMDQAPEQREKWSAAYQSASFYARLAEAQRLAQANNLEQALARVRPLTQQSGDAGRAARLLEADILRRQRRLDAAERAYRALLETRQNDVEARVGLVQVLSEKGEWSEAQQIAQTLPDGARSQVSGLTSTQVEALRAQARQQDNFGAEVNLRQALALEPDNPWVRLDLARLMVEQSRPDEAQALMASFSGASATPEQRYAVALFASEQDRWGDTLQLLSSIPSANLTTEMRSLQQQAHIQQPLSQALAQLEQGNRTAAISALQQLYQHDGGRDLTPSQVGQIADALSQAGATEEALRWVERDIARGVDEQAPNSYITHVLVMAQAGRPDAARQLLGRLSASSQWREDQDAMEVERGLAIIEADQLRQSGRLASAYDRLAEPIRQAPDDEGLLLAMARLYADGDRQAQAEQIYTYALTRHPDSQQALEGAVQSALSNNRPRQADQLLSRYSPEQPTADMWLLRAQVARANGNSREALALLSQARQKLGAEDGGAVMLAQGNNPFTDRAPTRTAATSQRPNWLPGAAQRTGDVFAFEQVDDAPLTTAQRIDELAKEIRRERAPKVTTEFAFNLRDGESGLSRQDRIEAPVGFSFIPYGEGRFEVQVTPSLVSSGTPEGESLRRFGSSGLGESAAALNQSLGGVSDILDNIQSSVDGYFVALDRFQAATNQQEEVRLGAELEEAQRFYENALTRNPLYEAGLTIADLTQEQRDLFNRIILDDSVDFDALSLDGTSREAFIESRQQFERAIDTINQRLEVVAAGRGRPSSLRDSGAGLALSYENGSVSMDVGSTPLGFEETNVVGGISWRPQISENTSLAFTAERRAVKDSVLSYAGAHDAYSGDTWGGVVRTGGRAGVNYDTDAGGLYADIGAYRYTGHNVADNQSYELSLGGYARPVNNERRQLQTGVHVSAMAFDDDLSHFTYGHGGYFSPQDYVSVAFPINYRENVSDQLTLGGYIAPGFQSYSTDDSDYFPTDPEFQALMDVFADLGATPASRYSGESESGVGLSLGGAMEYRMTPDLSLGGRVDFNSFGDYNDTSASVFMNYIFGESGERAR